MLVVAGPRAASGPSLPAVCPPRAPTASLTSLAFHKCGGLAGGVNIPAGVTTIPSQAFFQCVNLASVILPAGITGIGNNAFHVCTSLARAVFAGAAPSVDTCQSAPAAGGFTACLFDGAAGFTAPT